MTAIPELIINGRFLCQRATGVQRVSREFTMALDKLLNSGALPPLNVRIIAPMEADFGPLRLSKIKTEHLSGGSGHLWEQVALARRVGRSRLLCLGNSAPIMSLLIGSSVAVMLHDQSYKLYPNDYSLSYRLVHTIMDSAILRKSHPLITVSNSEKHNIVAAHPNARLEIFVAPNGSWIEDADVSESDYLTSSEYGLGICVGGISDRKNIDGIFAVAAAMAERGHRFVFVTSQSERSTSFLDSLSDTLRAKISFTGFISNDELALLYRRASYLLYPSFYEASGLPPSEAMTFGCPVVVSELPVMRERCGDAALYCDPYDYDSMIMAAERLITDREFAADLSRRGRTQARQFTWRTQAREIVRALGLPGM